MREIEIKARLRSKIDVLASLQNLGAQLGEPKKQRDIVYSLPGAVDNEPDANWLRIRIENDSEVTFTLKRSVTNELDSIEHEVAVSDASELKSIIGYLGYELFSDLTKTRQKAKVGDIEICIDEVPELGSFIEAEKLCPENASYKTVAAELWQLLDRIGVAKTDEETSGYDVLVRQKDQASSTASV